MGQGRSSASDPEIPKEISVNVQFGKRMKSGVVGVIYIWEKNEKEERSLTISSRITPKELVKVVCPTFDEDSMDFELTFCRHGVDKDLSSLSSLNTPLKALTKVGTKDCSESLWDLGLRQFDDVQIQILTTVEIFS